MTRREIAGERSDFLERAFGRGWKAGSAGSVPGDVRGRDEWRGGLPNLAGVLVPGPAAQWEREVAAYVEAVIPIGAQGTRADLGRLLRTFRYLAANSGQLLNVTRAASELSMQANTVRSHLELLEAVDLLLVHPDGRLVPIEVKASRSVGPGDTAGLAAFVAEHPDRSQRGVVIYDGDAVVDLSPSGARGTIFAVPRSLL